MMTGKLAAAGIRLTPQRMAVLEFLEGNTSHPSAEDIFRAVKQRYPGVSFATIYNTLETLKRVEGVRELKIDASRRRYDPNTKAHHHLICESCGTIVDVHADYHLDIPPGVAGSFDVAGNHVEFFGTCRSCANRKAERGENPKRRCQGRGEWQ